MTDHRVLSLIYRYLQAGMLIHGVAIKRHEGTPRGGRLSLFLVKSTGLVKRRVAAKALTAYKDRIRKITRRSGGKSIEQAVAALRTYKPGWKQYFRLSNS